MLKSCRNAVVIILGGGVLSFFFFPIVISGIAKFIIIYSKTMCIFKVLNMLEYQLTSKTFGTHT